MRYFKIKNQLVDLSIFEKSAKHYFLVHRQILNNALKSSANKNKYEENNQTYTEYSKEYYEKKPRNQGQVTRVCMKSKLCKVNFFLKMKKKRKTKTI